MFSNTNFIKNLKISTVVDTKKMEKLLKLKLQKKAQAQLTNKMTSLIGAVILIFLVTALAPEIFDQIDGLTGVEATTPAWVYTVMVVIVGAGLIFLVWRAFNN